MAIALTAPDSVVVGEVIAFSVAGATASGELDVQVYAEEGDGGVGVQKAKFAAALGAWASTGNLDVAPNTDGHVIVKVTDVTAVATVEKRVEVFQT